MKRGWMVATAALLLIFALFSYESFKLSLSDALGPGPGFFPFWLAVLGAVLAIALLVQVYLGRVDLRGEELVFDRARMGRAVMTLVALIAATALLEVAGFRLAMLLLIGFLLVVLGARSRTAIAICAVAGSFGVYHVFFDLLKVPLPAGMFGF